MSKVGDLLLAPICGTLRERVSVMPIEEVDVVLSQLGDQAGVIGVACWAANAYRDGFDQLSVRN